MARKTEPEPLRICHVCSSLSAGGLARVVLDLGAEPTEGVEFSLIATAFPGIHWPASGGAWVRRAAIERQWKLSRYAHLYRILRRWQPHIVHSHQEAYAPVVARCAGVPVRIETIHLVETWRELGHPCVRMARRRAVTRHVAVSTGMLTEILSAGLLAPSKLTAIPNGVLVGSPPANCPARGLSAPHIGTVGRLVEQKGITHLITAFAVLSREFPSARLTIAGDGPLRGALEDQIREEGLQQRVSILGYVGDPRAVLRQLDIFVLPSLWEGFGLSLAEAMAEGVPCIASRLAAVVSFCEDGEQGLLVPPGDPAAIVAGCKRLLQDAALRARLAGAAYERVQSEFSVDRMRAAHLDLYRRILEAPGPGIKGALCAP